MKVRNCLLLLVTFAFAVKLNAQPPSGEGIAKYSFDYHKIIPGMPENASLGAYGNIPVSTAKGLPNVSFNLYTVSKGGVNIPISISYLTSGVTVNTIPSSVGVNWSLDAGGSVDRSVNGLVDEAYLLNNMDKIDPAYMDYQNFHVNSHEVQDTSKRVAEQSLDCSLDYYYYSFPGHSGSMYLGDDSKFRADKEFKGLKISYSNNLESFSIKDVNGNTYIFGNVADESMVYNSGKYLPQSFTSMSAKVSWKLSKIITATKQEINFEYTSYYYEYWSLDSERFTAYTRPCGEPYGFCSSYIFPCDDDSYQTTRFVNQAKLVSKIYTDDQEVLFDYVEDSNLDIFQKKLSSIKIYSKISGDTVKKFSFTHAGDYLTGFSEADKDGHDYGKEHSFQYNGMPAPDPLTKSRDIYGYFNGASNTTLLAHSAALSWNYLYPLANRNVTSSAAAGTLSQITYPTGGRTTFQYENNTETVGANTYYAPGIRIQSIWDIDVTNNVYNKKNFYYSGLWGGNTYIQMTNNNELNLEPAMEAVLVSENPESLFRSGYFYRKVITETLGNDAAASHLFEIDYYDVQYDLFDKYSPLLVKKNIYNEDTFHLQKSVLYDYEIGWNEGLSTKTYALRKPIPHFGAFSYEDDPAVYNFCPPKTIYDGYDLKHILRPIVYELDSMITKEFTSLGDSLVTVTHYEYNSYGLTQRVQTVDFDNIMSYVIYSYPNATDGATFGQMEDSFIVSPIIKEQYFIDFKRLKKVKEKSYSFNSNGFFTVSDEIITDATTGKFQALHYYGYNKKARPLSMGRTGETPKSYIWDYLNELPIAEVINADTLSIAYTSFEADGKGRWTFSGSPAADSTSVTGRKTYALSGGAITRTGLSSSLRYFISYWSKGSSISIAGTQAGWPKALATINRKGQSWTLYEHQVTGQTSLSLSGSVTIDELRFYPENAQMTTYTYQPLTGVTSQCDADGRIVYYEYDGLQRLVLVRDQYQNVVRRICYNIKGQQEDCSQSVYWNKTISQTFSKNNCGAGYTGSKIVYSIPAGTYSSAVSQKQADSLALIGFSVNGQNYANTHGTCISIWYNVAKSGSFAPTVCDSGYWSLLVDYNVPAGTYSSLVSQADADAKAQADVDANGQDYANAHATCFMFCGHCSAENKKCIEFECETGVKVYEGTSVWDPEAGKYRCYYHYEFSDDSWSPSYYDLSTTVCFGA